MRRIVLGVLVSAVAALLVWSGPSAPEPPANVEWIPDVLYTRESRLDVAMPKGAGPFPAIVCIHGGGWYGGSRKYATWFIFRLAQLGYVGVAVDYRLAPRSPFPAARDDVRSAVRWLRGNAREFRVDPGRIGAQGDSAGGHLTALLAVAPGDMSSRVAAAVCFYGVYDLTGEAGGRQARPDLVRAIVTQFLGGAQARDASPASLVTRDAAPMLLIHGTADDFVPPEQADFFERRLKDAGASVVVVHIAGASHGFLGGQFTTAMDAMMKFFDARLSAKSNR